MGVDNKVAEIKENDSKNMEGLQRIIQKLMNTVIDMKRNSRESTNGNEGDYNSRKSFKPFYRKMIEGGHGQLSLPTPPNGGILNMAKMALIGSLLTKEEPIVELEPE